MAPGGGGRLLPPGVLRAGRPRERAEPGGGRGARQGRRGPIERRPAAGSRGPPGGTPDAGGLPARSRGVIGLLEENCTVCMLCARECPDWCIYIESHKEPVPGRVRRRSRRTRRGAAGSGCATSWTGSRSTSRCACTAGSASRRAPTTPCSGRRSSLTPRPTSRPHPRAGQAARVDVDRAAAAAHDPGAPTPREVITAEGVRNLAVRGCSAPARRTAYSYLVWQSDCVAKYPFP